MRHTKKKILPFVFASGLLASSLAQAAQLGKLEVLSSAGEPFVAEIQVDLVAPEERASLQARLASAEAFKAARLTMDPNLKSLQFSVQDGAQPGTARVKITADKPLPAGFIDTLVELTWAGGRVAREYTLTIPVGPVAAQEAPATRLPEIRPPMTPPQATTPQLPPQAAPNVAQQASAPQSRNLKERGNLQVQRGDTLSELALELAGDGVSLNQAMAALYEANKDSFINGSVHMIREGAQIQVPNRAALRSRSSNEALLILAQNDDRNVYSAYARQIGLLTVENQSTASSATSTQGTIAPVQEKIAVAAPKEDRLQIAPGATQGTGNADAGAEELTAKNKALAEANERIALLEKNVSDLQRLLDMQNDIAEPAAGSQGGNTSEGEAGADALDASDTAAAVELPSDALGEPADDKIDTTSPVENAADSTEGATEGVEAPVAETPAEDAPFDWMPWILGGVGGLAVLVVLLLIARSRRNKEDEEGSGFDTDDNASFSEVNQFDEAAAAASTGAAAERASSLSKSEDSDFDLDEVLNDRLKQTEGNEATRLVPPVAADPAPDEPKSSSDNIPELNDASDEALQQKDSLNSDVNLEFPEEDTVAAGSSNSILDDLDDIEKGTLAAQEELEKIRKQPVTTPDDNDFDASSAFDDLIDSDPNKQEAAADANAEKSSIEAENSNTEDEFDQAMVDLDVDVPNPKVDDATWQEVATKLDLAGAYVEIGDADGAKELLNEIVKKGDVDQVRKAKALLATLN